MLWAGHACSANCPHYKLTASLLSNAAIHCCRSGGLSSSWSSGGSKNGSVKSEVLHLVQLNSTGLLATAARSHTASAPPSPTPPQLQPFGLASFLSPGQLQKFTG